MKTDPVVLQQKLSDLKDSGVLTESEFRYIEQKIIVDGIPWLSIASVVLGCFGLILLEAEVTLIGELLTIADLAAAGGLVSGILALLKRERTPSVAAIGIFVSLSVLTIVNVVNI